jgi:beta-N-acetylhexosaminidase
MSSVSTDEAERERLILAAGRCVLSGLDGGGLERVETALGAGRLGGLILFREDLPTLSDGRALIARARALARHTLLVGADEEGGIVSQLDGLSLAPESALLVTGAPSPRTLGDAGDPAFTEHVYVALGKLLRAAGFDVAFAPVLDVNVERDNPVIGSRSFGSTPAVVATHALAAVRGLGAAGMLATGKHFPGHGAASADSHDSLPTIPGSREEIARRDLPPFVGAIRAGVPLIMSAHVFAPGLDPEERPATLSRPILTGVLRDELGFEGVVVSDAL